MKNLIAACIVLFLYSNLSAKKVKFSVDMTGQTISPNGIHVVGDFQALAGLGADWDPATAVMVQEGTTSLYSLIVNIPAFKKYEYRFLNGDQTYESEFIPEESRVQYDDIDNRWLFVDSLKNDTTFVGALLFGGNAPTGKKLLRFKIDLRLNAPVATSGIHVGTSYQTVPYSANEIRLYAFQTGIYEVINYVAAGTYSYIFYNGNTALTVETLPASCSSSGYRVVAVPTDIVLPLPCFSSCEGCKGVGISENQKTNSLISFFPNPAKEQVTIDIADDSEMQLSVKDISGKEVISLPAIKNGETLNVSSLQPGLYFIFSSNSAGSSQVSKLVID